MFLFNRSMSDKRGEKRQFPNSLNSNVEENAEAASKKGRANMVSYQHTGVESVNRARRPPNTEFVIAILSQRDYLDDYYKNYANVKDIKYILPCALTTLRKDADKFIEAKTNTLFWQTVKTMIQKEQQVGDELIANYVFLNRSIQTFFNEYDAVKNKAGERRFTSEDITSLTDSITAIFDMLLLALIAKVHKEENNRLVRRQLTVMKDPAGKLLLLRESAGESQAMGICEKRTMPIRIFDKTINNIINHLIHLFPKQAYESFVEANYDINSQPIFLGNNLAGAEERAKVVVEKYNVTLAFATGYVEPGARLNEIPGTEGPVVHKPQVAQNISRAIAPMTGFRATAVGSGVVGALRWMRDTANTVVEYWRSQERSASVSIPSATAAINEANARLDAAGAPRPAPAIVKPLPEVVASNVQPSQEDAARLAEVAAAAAEAPIAPAPPADVSGSEELNAIVAQQQPNTVLGDENMDDIMKVNPELDQSGGRRNIRKSKSRKTRRRVTRNRKNMRSKRTRMSRKFL